MDLDALVEQITDEVCRRIQAPERVDTYGGGKADLAAKLEYTLMDPRLKLEDIEHMCEAAKAKNLACICIPQWFVEFAKNKLKDTGVMVCTCVGLPGGNSATAAKYAEVKEAVKNGADEVDIPINMEFALKEEYEELKNDLEEAMVPAKNKAIVKAVIELGQLSDDQLKKTLEVCLNCGVDYIAVSRILAGRAHNVSEIRGITPLVQNTKIKVIGELREASFISELLNAGVDRIGTSTANNM